MNSEQGIRVSAEIKLNKFHFAARKPMLTRSVVTLLVCAMNPRVKYLLLAFVLLNFTFAGISDAAAYLDPGTGSIIFQSVIAAIATGLAVLATAWKNVVVLINRLFGSNNKKQSDKDS